MFSKDDKSLKTSHALHNSEVAPNRITMNSSIDHALANNTTRRYVSQPVGFSFKVTLYTFLGLLGLYSSFANGLIFIFKRRQQKRNKRARRRKAFSRSNIFSTYIQSLALSDFLCSAIVIPLAIATNFDNVFNTDYKCKGFKYLNLMITTVTIDNLFVIGVERYMTVFYPLKLPSKRTIKCVIVLSWIVGLLIPILPSLTFALRRHNIAYDRYTLLCWYSTTAFAYNGLALGVLSVTYVVGFAVPLTMSIRIVRHLRLKFPRDQLRRFRGTNTFITLIFVFIIPYLFPLIYSLITPIFKVSIPFELDLKMRCICAVLIYSNSAISPTVMIFSMEELRVFFSKDLFKCCAKRRVDNDFRTNSIGLVNFAHLELSPVLIFPNVLDAQNASQKRRNQRCHSFLDSMALNSNNITTGRTVIIHQRSKSI